MLNQPIPMVGVDRRTINEYDPYYKTRINRHWTYEYSPCVLGYALILFGLLSFIFTCIDISLGALVRPLFQNPNNEGAGISLVERADLAATWQENTIWPTTGKGIWVGFLMICTGILSILSRKDGTRVSILALSAFSWTTVIFSLYLILSSILSVQVYPYNNVNNRTYHQNIELAMNILLIIMGFFAFWASLWLAIKSIRYLEYFVNGRSRPRNR